MDHESREDEERRILRKHLETAFGFLLIVMAVGVCFGTLTSGQHMPEVFSNFKNLHPKGTPIWSFMFIEILI